METSFTNSIEPNQDSLVEISKDEIDFIEKLGEGNFGIVMKCLLKQQNIECACKTLKDSNNIKAFFEIQTEVNNMVKLRHHNIVALYGIVKDGERIRIVTEFCGGGPLKNRLLDKKKPKLLVTTLIDYTKQAASGMNYLSQKKIVHRDLATRNVLLMIDEKTIKIADFGLARIIKDDKEYYSIQSNPKIPIACTAPECLKDGKWSTSSDVWSYGIMLIEMFSYGECIHGIFSNMRNFFQNRINLAQLRKIIKNGDPFKRPNACPLKIYELTQECFEIDPMERPNFENIKTKLSNYQLSISEVIVNSNSYYNSDVDDNKNEYLPVKKDDCIVVINDLDVDRFYCQDLKTRDFGYVSTYILNAIKKNSNNFQTQNELEEIHDGVDPYITPISNDPNQYSETSVRQNSFPNSISPSSSNPKRPLLESPNKGEDRIYCQNVKSHQFGIIGAEKLNFVADSATEKLYDSSYLTPIQLSNIFESSRLISLPTRNEALKLEASRSDTSTSFLNRLFGMKWLIILGIVIFCSLLSLIILAIWYKNPFAIAMSDVETTTYIVPTEVISTTTQTEVNSKYECPDYIWSVIASEEVTYIIGTVKYTIFNRKRYVYKIQNQRVVKKVDIDDFFVPRNFSLYIINAGYIRNGSLILLDREKQVHVYVFDPIPIQSDKFKLREGFPKKTPINNYISGAIMINDMAYVFEEDGNNYPLIYDERFNNVTTWMDLKINFPNFPKRNFLYFKGGHTTSSNGQKFLTLFINNITTFWFSTLEIPQVYTYDLERKNLVGGVKNLTEYLLNCE